MIHIWKKLPAKYLEDHMWTTMCDMRYYFQNFWQQFKGERKKFNKILHYTKAFA